MRLSLMLTLILALGCRKEEEDADGDGYRAGLDCDDADAGIHPDADETCDGIDQDCDGTVDEDAIDALAFYADYDGDGYGNPDITQGACAQPQGYVEDASDCDDSDPAYHPGAAEDCAVPEDFNCDGSVGYADADADGVPACEDCDDTDAAINPSATEVCDQVDNDCDGTVDLGAVDALSWYADRDLDGYGDPEAATRACAPPDGAVANNTDCDDGAPLTFPGAPETCDDLDNNCNSIVDEDATDASLWYADSDGDGYGGARFTQRACQAPEGYLPTAGDCDDLDPALNPDTTWFADADHDTYGDPSSSLVQCDQPVGYVLDDQDCDDLDQDLNPLTPWYSDADRDGFGSDATPTRACLQPAGRVRRTGDCDDDSDARFPGNPETCDGLDNNCNSVVDEDPSDASSFFLDADGDGFGADRVSTSACLAPAGYVPDAGDCDDLDPALNPDTTWFADHDLDAFGDDHNTLVQCAQPTGYVLTPGDCDDADPDTSPLTWWYDDLDGDGFGRLDAAQQACLQPPNAVRDPGDCDDASPLALPGGREVCDGRDNDCDGRVDPPAFDLSLDRALGAGWSLNGSAVHLFDPLHPAVDGVVQLTPDDPAVGGSLFPHLTVDAGRWYARFWLDLYDGTQADGLALAVLNTTDPAALGGLGGGLGCADLDGLCVGFDTYNGPDHIEVWAGLDRPNNFAYTEDADPFYQTGPRRADVFWDHGQLQVFLDGVRYVNAPVSGLGLPAGDDVMIGWTAATGGGTQVHELNDLFLGCATDEDLDGDGFSMPDDCDDTDPGFHPGADDRFGDGVDLNCDGADGVDEDGDGEASAESDGPDCDDTDAALTSTAGCVYPASCAEILAADSAAPSGFYWIDAGAGLEPALCDMVTDGGGWTLLMSINPSDGHIGGWGTDYWYGGEGYGAVFRASDEDYLSAGVQGLAVNELMIANHSHGVRGAWRRWDFLTPGTSFSTEINTAFRSVVTTEIQAEDTTGAASNDPIFAYTGALYFNYYYSNNGTRVSVAGQRLPGLDENTDDHYGLGVEYCHNEGHVYSSVTYTSSCRYDGDASLADLRTSCQGTDHGVHCTIGNSDSYQYGLWVR
ncbi:MAG: hypothetical protein JXX28_12560 [Deltaproteobacteria bacterium]|nr:hypothetical protein [Deltaproteobacteria bacterium]